MVWEAQFLSNRAGSLYFVYPFASSIGASGYGGNVPFFEGKGNEPRVATGRLGEHYGMTL